MKIALAKKTQKLANLHLPNSRLKKIAQDFLKIIEFVNTVSKANVSAFNDFFNPSGRFNVAKKDKPFLSYQLSNKKALLNAPKKYKGYFVVPKVINGEDNV